MASISANKNYVVPTVNADNNVWGSELNSTLAAIDLNLGGSQSVSLASGNVVASAVQASTLVTTFTGLLTAPVEYILPAGYGGILIFDNQTTGAFTATVASAGGGTTTLIPQGSTLCVWTDGTNVTQASSAVVGNATIYSGNLTLTAGNVVLTSGNLVLTAGNLAVNNGGISVTSGTFNTFTAILTGTTALGAINANVNNVGTQALAQWFNGATAVGSITTDGTTTTYGTTSDARLKEPFATHLPFGSGRIIDRLKPRWFRWKRRDAEPEPGFFAQELHRVFPWAVRRGSGRPGSKNFQPWQTDVAKLMPVVIAELQFLRRRVAELERQAVKSKGGPRG